MRSAAACSARSCSCLALLTSRRAAFSSSCRPTSCPGVPVRARPRRKWLWPGRAQSRRRCGRGERSPGADVGGVSPVPAQMRKRRPTAHLELEAPRLHRLRGCKRSHHARPLLLACAPPGALVAHCRTAGRVFVEAEEPQSRADAPGGEDLLEARLRPERNNLCRQCDYSVPVL